MADLRFESLHNHTVISDGVQTHLQSLADAEELGIGVMAFTDHDTLPDKAVLAGLRAYDGPVKWLVGVELSSAVPKAVGGLEKGAVHILGLFVDVANSALVEFCAAAEASRIERMKLYVKHLQEVGFDVTEADVRAAATSRNIGKPHMVKAVLAKPANRAHMEALREEMRLAAEHDAALKARYDRMMADGPNQYPYVLFMGSNSFKPMAASDFGSALLPYEDTVKLIRGAGGLAVAAHWHLEPEKMNKAELEVVLTAGGLDGIESETINIISKRDVSAAAAETRELAERFGAFEIVTSDSHKRADLAAFVADSAAERTIGATVRLVEKFRPDLEWSNLAQ
jgi:predicted metal-dependent phosphoesterase TrpH